MPLYRPAEDTENQIEHKEGADDDEWDVIDPRERAAKRVISLQLNISIQRKP